MKTDSWYNLVTTVFPIPGPYTTGGKNYMCKAAGPVFWVFTDVASCFAKSFPANS